MYEFWTDPVVVFLLTFGGIVITVILWLYDKRRDEVKHRQLLAAASKKGHYFRNFVVTQDIHNLEGESTRISDVTIVNTSEVPLKETFHTIWSTERGEGYEVWAETRKGTRLNSEMVTDTASYNKIKVFFPDEGVPPHGAFSYKLFARNRTGFPNLRTGEWCELEADSRVDRLGLRVIMPVGSKATDVACRKLSPGQTAIVQPRIRMNREHRQVIEISPEESQDGVTYRIDFKMQ